MAEGKRVRVWHAEDGWRWQKWSSSDIVAESGEAYEEKSTAVEMAEQEVQPGDQLIVEE